MNSDDTTLYRMYDQWDRLLYVGITSDVPSRFRAHRSEKPWWTDIATIKLAHFPERVSARAAEVRAIADEGPAFNIADAPYQRAELSRESVLLHYTAHQGDEWCDICECWPHLPITREDGWCSRCLVHSADHEWDAGTCALYGHPARPVEPTAA